MDMQHEHATWTCIMNMQHGHAAWRHGYAARRRRHAAWRHAAWTSSMDSSMDMQHEYATWTCSISMQHGHIDTHHGHEHAAATDMDMTWIQNSTMNNTAGGQIVPVYYIAAS
jgi:hypothetical protein